MRNLQISSLILWQFLLNQFFQAMKSLTTEAWEIFSSIDGSALSDAKQTTVQMANIEKVAKLFMQLNQQRLTIRIQISINLLEYKIYHEDELHFIFCFILIPDANYQCIKIQRNLKKQKYRTKYVSSTMDLVRLTTKLSQTEFLPETSILRKSIRQTPEIIKVLLKLVLRRERYCFQFFKYFILFSSSSQMSETQSIDSYDKLIFGDDAIHSVFKIFESKQLQNMIWAFINIKALKYLQKCKIFTKKISKAYVEKIQKPVKHHAFQMIKQYDLKVQQNITDNKHHSKSKYVDQQTNTFHRQKLGTRQNLYEVKIDGKNYFNSNIMIQSSENGDPKSIGQSHKFKNVQNAKLSQSHHMVEEPNLTQSQEGYPSRISLKSRTSEQNKRESFHNGIQAPSQTKIRFTYTSPTKQQLTQYSQESHKAILKQGEPQKRKDQYPRKYMYTVPKIFQDKKICCENLCGIGCGDHCSMNCKGDK